MRDEPWLTRWANVFLGRSPRQRRKSHTLGELACLEERILLSAAPALEIGATESFSYFDADGDAVEVRISGTAGHLEFSETIGDGVGNDDGTFEDGESLGSLVVSAASSDFSITVTHRDDLGRGDGVVFLGRVEAIDQTILGIFSNRSTVGPSRIEVGSVHAAGLTGGIDVDSITGDETGLGIALNSLAAGARIDVAGSLLGHIVIRDDLHGTINVGGLLSGDLTVGRSMTETATVHVGESLTGDVRILDDFSGAFDVDGNWSADLKIGGNASALGRITAAGALTGDVEIVGSFHGDFMIGSTWNGDLKVGDTYGATALVRTGSHFIGEARFHGVFQGDVLVGGRTYGQWMVTGTVWGTASFVAGLHWTSLHVASNFFGQVVAPGSIVLTIDGHIGSTARIGSSASHLTIVSTTGFISGAVHASSAATLTASGGLLSIARVGSLGSATILIPGSLPVGVWIRAARTSIARLPSSTPTGFDTGLVISRSGYYKLSRDIIYGGASGNAIEIRASNVVLDLNGHAVAGTAGSSSAAVGIRTFDMSNVRVINGSVRGFQIGIFADGKRGYGYSIENVRAESNWYGGIWLEGPQSTIRDCQVVSTGGSTYASDYTIPIAARMVGPAARMSGTAIVGMKRSPINIEVVGLHIDSAPSAVISDSLFHLRDGSRYNSWGAWVNPGPVAPFGITDALFADNTFAGSEYAISYAWAQGSHRDNTALGVVYEFDYNLGAPGYGGVNGGGNLELL